MENGRKMFRELIEAHRTAVLSIFRGKPYHQHHSFIPDDEKLQQHDPIKPERISVDALFFRRLVVLLQRRSRHRKNVGASLLAS